MSVQIMLMLLLCCIGGLNGETVGSKEDTIKWNNFVTSVNQKLNQFEGALIEKDDKIKSLEVKIDEQRAVYTRRFETQELKISQQCEELSNLKMKVASILWKTSINNNINQFHQKNSDRLRKKHTSEGHTKTQSLQLRPWSSQPLILRSLKNGINGKSKNDQLFQPNTDDDGRINGSNISVGFNLTYTPRNTSVTSFTGRQPMKNNYSATSFHRSIASNQPLKGASLGELKNSSNTSRRPLKIFSSERQGNPRNDFVHNFGNNMEYYNYPPGHRSNAVYSSRPTGCNCDVKKAKQKLQQKRVPPDTHSVAFHVTLSASKSTVDGNTIVYDQEMLDIGDGYNPTDGVYIVPESGIYVMTWTTLAFTHDVLQTRLIVNGVIKGASWTDSENIGDIHQTTAVVVLMLTRGDHVFIRVGETLRQSIYSSAKSYHAQPTFSGWKLN